MQNQSVKNLEEYKARKEALLKEAFDFKFGDMKFTEQDHKANQLFQKLTNNFRSQIDTNFHFQPILYRELIESSCLYKLSFDMPKGSQHHSHNPCSLPSSWFIEHTMVPNAYISDEQSIEFFEKPPEEVKWKNILKLKEEASNKEEFDKKFEENFHLTLKDLKDEAIWDKFMFKIANRTNVVFQSGEVWEEYMLNVFLEAIEEGYSNMQMRNLIPFNEHKIFMDPEVEVQRYRRALAKAQEKDPDFSVGITFTALRFWDIAKVKALMDIAAELCKKHRDIIVGFDLVGEEDLREAEHFAHMFIENKKKTENEGFDHPLLLHAGESLNKANDNLYDVFILDAPRIGHGFNLAKHPHLMPKIKEKKICIEVNPLSNQMMQYVADLRLHPAILYHNYGIRISISSDDNGIFNLTTIWDFFVATICFEFDLLDFKRVITNSIEASCMEQPIINKMMKSWEKRWEQFVLNIIEGRYDQI